MTSFWKIRQKKKTLQCPGTDQQSYQRTGTRKIIKNEFAGDCMGRDPRSTHALANQHSKLISKRIKTIPNDIQTFHMIYRWKGIEVYFILLFMEWGFDVYRRRYGYLSD